MIYGSGFFKMGVTRMFLGLGILIFGIIFFLNSTQAIFLIDNKEQSITLFENINTTNTTVNLQFNFTKDYISKIYVISDGGKIYKNYLNFFINDFRDNTTTKNITYFQLNDYLYSTENKSYETSLIIVEETLNKEFQNIEIEKSTDLVIDKITLEYRGATYDYKNEYDIIIFLLSLLIIFFGIILGLYQA